MKELFVQFISWLIRICEDNSPIEIEHDNIEIIGGKEVISAISTGNKPVIMR